MPVDLDGFERGAGVDSLLSRELADDYAAAVDAFKKAAAEDKSLAAPRVNLVGALKLAGDATLVLALAVGGITIIVALIKGMAAHRQAGATTQSA